jgi:hypothetical protein
MDETQRDRARTFRRELTGVTPTQINESTVGRLQTFLGSDDPKTRLYGAQAAKILLSAQSAPIGDVVTSLGSALATPPTQQIDEVPEATGSGTEVPASIVAERTALEGVLLGAASAPESVSEYATAVIDRLESDDPVAVRRALAICTELAEHDWQVVEPAIPRIEAIVETHPVPFLRAYAVLPLIGIAGNGIYHDSLATDHVATLLRADDPAVRKYAAVLAALQTADRPEFSHRLIAPLTALCTESGLERQLPAAHTLAHVSESNPIRLVGELDSLRALLQTDHEELVRQGLTIFANVANGTDADSTSVVVPLDRLIERLRSWDSSSDALMVSALSLLTSTILESEPPTELDIRVSNLRALLDPQRPPVVRSYAAQCILSTTPGSTNEHQEVREGATRVLAEALEELAENIAEASESPAANESESADWTELDRQIVGQTVNFVMQELLPRNDVLRDTLIGLLSADDSEIRDVTGQGFSMLARREPEAVVSVADELVDVVRSSGTDTPQGVVSALGRTIKSRKTVPCVVLDAIDEFGELVTVDDSMRRQNVAITLKEITKYEPDAATSLLPELSAALRSHDFEHAVKRELVEAIARIVSAGDVSAESVTPVLLELTAEENRLAIRLNAANAAIETHDPDIDLVERASAAFGDAVERGAPTLKVSGFTGLVTIAETWPDAITPALSGLSAFVQGDTTQADNIPEEMSLERLGGSIDPASYDENELLCLALDIVSSAGSDHPEIYRELPSACLDRVITFAGAEEPELGRAASELLYDIAGFCPGPLGHAVEEVGSYLRTDDEVRIQYLARTLYRIGRQSPAAITPAAPALIDKLDSVPDDLLRDLLLPMGIIGLHDVEEIRAAVDTLVHIVTSNDSGTTRHTMAAIILTPLAYAYPDDVQSVSLALDTLLYGPTAAQRAGAMLCDALAEHVPDEIASWTDELLALVEEPDAELAKPSMSALRKVSQSSPLRFSGNIDRIGAVLTGEEYPQEVKGEAVQVVATVAQIPETRQEVVATASDLQSALQRETDLSTFVVVPLTLAGTAEPEITVPVLEDLVALYQDETADQLFRRYAALGLLEVSEASPDRLRTYNKQITDWLPEAGPYTQILLFGTVNRAVTSFDVEPAALVDSICRSIRAHGTAPSRLTEPDEALDAAWLRRLIGLQALREVVKRQPSVGYRCMPLVSDLLEESDTYQDRVVACEVASISGRETPEEIAEGPALVDSVVGLCREVLELNTTDLFPEVALAKGFAEGGLTLLAKGATEIDRPGRLVRTVDDGAEDHELELDIVLFRTRRQLLNALVVVLEAGSPTGPAIASVLRDYLQLERSYTVETEFEEVYEDIARAVKIVAQTSPVEIRPLQDSLVELLDNHPRTQIEVIAALTSLGSVACLDLARNATPSGGEVGDP